MRPYTRVGTALLVSTLAGAADAQLRPADEAAIRQFVATFERSWNARDGSALAALYRPDADQILGLRPAVTGRAEIERQWSAILPSLPQGLTITIRVESIRPVTPDVVVVNATGTFAGGRDAAGKPLPRSSDRATNVLARDGAAWKIASLRVFDAEQAPDGARGVRAARDRFVEAWRRGDAKAAAAVFAPDAVNMRPGAADDRGREAIERLFTEFLSTVQMEHAEFTSERIDVRPYVAYELGTFVQRYRPAGKEPETQRGRYVAVWRREPGGEWQYDRFLFNWQPAQPAQPSR